jgi:hypothetical protein
MSQRSPVTLTVMPSDESSECPGICTVAGEPVCEHAEVVYLKEYSKPLLRCKLWEKQLHHESSSPPPTRH